ncbi:proline dehydrogenase family protein [Marinobacterium sediminicola]|uniref:L-proline dehydrogenase n=1 Tax=Marinobacterium sediminicola TaxID=518898 RepID=A0ABY1RWW9_9GAMM|nr:proline dehydrogenase family protein [Marinobacterium sediminicola]ULG67923.1 proline dehydrogenase family protein [Marinobacterium sediminicola]SMR71367.1 L-proline dehydrogenase [Marinobacterium sediminicola]
MLPLSIFFSDEYRLLSRQQLAKGIGQYFVLPDQTLMLEWKTLKDALPSLSAGDIMEAGTHHIDAPHSEPPLNAVEANQRFNEYLKRLEQVTSCVLVINPADLHPRYEALNRNRIREGICNRLHVLALQARENMHQLVLRAPNEATVELTLEILACTLTLPGLEHWGHLGICLQTCSKRALPTLGWLEHLGRSLNTNIPVKLISGMPTREEIREAQHAGHVCYPVLTNPDHCRSNFECCHQFLLSSNNSRLRASRLLHRPIPKHYQAPPPPSDIFLPIRSNATMAPAGQTLADIALARTLQAYGEKPLNAYPVLNGESLGSQTHLERSSPIDVRRTIGEFHPASEDQIRRAFSLASDAQPQWNRLLIEHRIAIIQRWTERLQQSQHELLACCIHETGLSIRDAASDLRTAINLCHYYCNQALTKLSSRPLHGHQQEANRLELHGRGIYVAVTDHNEPFATAIGQLSALLVCGNAVLLNPDPCCTASLNLVIDHLLKSGLPSGLVSLLPGDEQVYQWMLEDYRVAGAICFTDPGQTIAMNAVLSNRKGAPVVPLLSHSSIPGTQIITRRLTTLEIRETLQSAFSHSGQKRTNLGILYIESTVADEIEQQLADSLQLLQMGDPLQLETDIGPMSHRNLMTQCHEHIERFRLRQRIITQLEPGEEHDHGYYVSPTLLRLYSLDELPTPTPGPLLHLIRFDQEGLGRVITEINRYCPGQACSIYSNDDALIDRAVDGLQASRLLVNRPLSDTCASIHPAGSSGFSGTGPLYGGPNYLMAFVRERAITCRRE